MSTKRFVAAHWILRQIFKDQPESFGQNVLIDSNGTLFIERDGIMYEMGESKGRIGYIQNQTRKYSKSVVTDAINLLVANEHAKLEFPTNTTYNDVFVTSTAKGAIAFRNEYYLKEANERLEKWPKRNWLLIAAITYFIGIVTPVIVDKLRSITQVQTKKEPTEQSLNKR